MTPVQQFLWGALGSIAVEVITVLQYFQPPHTIMPRRYREVAFYVVRALLACIGGGLVIAYGIDNKILAINIGAATPLIITNFAKKPPK